MHFATQNYCFAPSSCRNQQSTGLLRLIVRAASLQKIRGMHKHPSYFLERVTRLVCILLSQNNCFAPSSRRKQQSTGLLHLIVRASSSTKNKRDAKASLLFFGAGDEARTRYLHLGKVALYQMSYTRGTRGIITDFPNKSILFLEKPAPSCKKLQCILGVSGKSVTQNLVSFLNDHKSIRIDLRNQPF